MIRYWSLAAVVIGTLVNVMVCCGGKKEREVPPTPTALACPDIPEDKRSYDVCLDFCREHQRTALILDCRGCVCSDGLKCVWSPKEEA